MEKCVSCQFYDRKNSRPTDGRATMWGQCRRAAPHLNPMNVRPYVVEGIWPLVRDDDWCGEWKLLPPEIAEQVAAELVAVADTAPAPMRKLATSATSSIVPVATISGAD